MRYGFIGYGNMAGAIVEGLLQSAKTKPENIGIYEQAAAKRDLAAAQLLHLCENYADLISFADAIFLCVKPKDFPEVLQEISIINSALLRNKCFVSIAAGVPVSAMQKALGEGVPIVRTMPNTPLLVGMGATAICRNAFVPDETYAAAKAVFACAGSVYELEEGQLNDALNLNGSAPAYIFLLAKTAADYASATGGIAYETALSMFCDTLAGSAKMLQKSGKSADELIKNVSSPGGTTVAALQAFEDNGFTACLQAGFLAAVKRAEEMGKSQ